MQSVNGGHYLYITFLLVLFASAPAATVLLTDIFPLIKYICVTVIT